MIPGQSKKVQTVGLSAFIGAAVLFALGFVLMLTGSGTMMKHQLPLILMTIAAIDVCFAAALSSIDVPAAEKTRLRALSIVGAVVVVIAATMIAASFKVGAFEIVIMLVAVGGAPGMFKIGEFVGAKLKASDTSPAKPTAKEAAPAAEAVQKTAAEETPSDGESTPAT